MTTIGVLALQGDVHEHLGALTVAGARAIPIRRRSELEAVDGLVLPGGESTTIDRLLGIFELREPLRSMIRSGFPVFGSCAGMILLAEHVLDGERDQKTLGGIDMTVRRNAFGRQVDSFETDLVVDGLSGPPLRAVFIRAPWVEKVGPDVQILATVGTAPAVGRIVAVRQGFVLATSFHPEITGDARLHELFVSMVRKEH